MMYLSIFCMIQYRMDGYHYCRMMPELHVGMLVCGVVSHAKSLFFHPLVLYNCFCLLSIYTAILYIYSL